MAAMAAVGLLGCWVSAPAAAKTSANVVVVQTDDQAANELAAMVRTRALLADAGVTFTRAFASYPLCCPSRATLLTGRYAHNHRVLGNDPPYGGYERLDPWHTLPFALRSAGYRTAHVGKYLNGYGDRNRTEIPPGWDNWVAVVPTVSGEQYFNYTLNEGGALVTYGQDPDDYQTDVLRDLAVDRVHGLAQTGDPFFLSVDLFAPHSPSIPAPRHEGAFATAAQPVTPGFNEGNLSDKPRFLRGLPPLDPGAANWLLARHRARMETLLAADEAVAAIVAALSTEGELDNTFVFFTSDNGYFRGEHRIPAGKYLPYDPASRVPLIVRGPGISAGAKSRALVANIDLAPTVLAISRATRTAPVDGRSLLPFARRPARKSRRPLLFEASREPGDIVIKRSSTLGRSAGAGDLKQEAVTAGLTEIGGPPYRAIRTPRYLYVQYAGGDRELYDMARDPFQLHSVHLRPGYRRVRRWLRRRLARLAVCAGARCRRELKAAPRPNRAR